MFRRLLPCVALLGLVALPGTARPADDKKPATPGLVVRLQSLDELMNNFRYLAGLVGREEEAKQFEGMLKDRAGGPKGLEGIDAKRPFGGYAYFGEGGPENSKAVILIPIADDKAFLSLVENLGAKAEKGEDGVYTVTSPTLQVPVYFRFAHKYAYATALNKDAIDKDKLLPPSAVLPAGKMDVLSITVRVDQVPENLRNIAVSQVEAGLDASKDENKDKETEVEHAAKVEMIDTVKRGVVAILKDGGEMALRFDIDQKAQEMSLELALSGTDGSALAKDIAALGKHPSVVAGLISGKSVMNVEVNLPNNQPGLSRAVEALLKEQLQKDTAKQEDKTKKAQMEKAFKALEPALKFTDFDMALDFRGPGAGGLYTLVGGEKVANGATLDKAIRDVVKQLPEAERAKIKLDAEKAGDVTIHRADVSGADADFKKSFGDGPAYFAVRADAAFLAVGDDALAALKEALKVEPKVGKPAQFEVSVARVAAVMARDKPEAIQAAAKAFAKDKEADKVRFSLEAGRELKLRFSMKTPVLTFMHLMEPGANK